MAHDQLRFDHLNRIHRHANENQQRRSTEDATQYLQTQSLCQKRRQIGIHSGTDPRNLLDVEARVHQFRYQSDESEIEAAHESDPGKDVVDVLRRPLAWPDSWDETTVFTHVIGDFIRIVDDLRIEVAEEDDPAQIQQVVQGIAVRKVVLNP